MSLTPRSTSPVQLGIRHDSSDRCTPAGQRFSASSLCLQGRTERSTIHSGLIFHARFLWRQTFCRRRLLMPSDILKHSATLHQFSGVAHGFRGAVSLEGLPARKRTFRPVAQSPSRASTHFCAIPSLLGGYHDSDRACRALVRRGHRAWIRVLMQTVGHVSIKSSTGFGFPRCQ